MPTLLKLILAAIPVAATSSFVTASLVSPDQEPAQEPSHGEFSEAAMMEQMMKLAMPGKEHKEMMETVGNWDTTMRYRMSPDGPWDSASGKAKVQNALGGRYLVEKVSFNMMGMESEGLLIMGFDNLTKKYQAVWLDTMSTRMTYSEGAMDKNGVTEMTGTMVDFITPEGRPYRHVTTRKNKDHILVEMYDAIPESPSQPTPKEATVKVMELEYVRN